MLDDLTREELAKAKLSYRRKAGQCKHRQDRLGNPIEMRLTFEEWCHVWEESGHWGEWGVGRGKYCMSRYDDIGHYEIDNVFIQLHTENTAEEGRRRTGANNPNFGKKRQGEPTPAELALYVQNGKNTAQMIHTCPTCGKEGKGRVMFRWHMDNCQYGGKK